MSNAESKSGKPPVMWIVIDAVLVLVLLAGLLTVGYFTKQWWDDSSRQEVLDAATERVTKVYEVSPGAIDTDLVEVEEFATGDFADQWKKGKEKVREVVQSQGATVKVDVKGIAYAKGDSDSATVLLALDATSTFSVKIDKDDEKGKGKGKGKDKDKSKAKDKDKDGYPDDVENRMRVRATMSSSDSDWKLAKLEVMS